MDREADFFVKIVVLLAKELILGVFSEQVHQGLTRKVYHLPMGGGLHNEKYLLVKHLLGRR